MGFEIFLKRGGFLSRMKCDCCLKSPWAKLRGMSNLTRIMCFEPGINIISQSRVVVIPVRYADENIYVIKRLTHFHLFTDYMPVEMPGLSGHSSSNKARLRSKLRRGSLPSWHWLAKAKSRKVLAFLNEDWWRWRESNPRPTKSHDSVYVCSQPIKIRPRGCRLTGPPWALGSCYFLAPPPGFPILAPACCRRL